MGIEFADMGWPGFFIILVAVFLLGCWFCNWRAKRQAAKNAKPAWVSQLESETPKAEVTDEAEAPKAEVTDEAEADPAPAAAIDEDALVAKVVEAMKGQFPQGNGLSASDIDAIVTKVASQVTFDNIADATEAQRKTIAEAAETEAARITALRVAADEKAAEAEAVADTAAEEAELAAGTEEEAKAEAARLRAIADKPVCRH